jgi:diguanylate cyclase (GGDEF)-like protein/PAS domain S-box-containing protein
MQSHDMKPAKGAAALSPASLRLGLSLGVALSILGAMLLFALLAPHVGSEASGQGSNYLVAGLALAFILSCLLFGRAIDQAWRQREQVLAQLNLSHAALTEAEQIAHLGHYRLDLSTGLWVSSANMDRIFGIGPDYPRDVDGWLRLIDEEQRPQMQAYLQQVFNEGIGFDRQYLIQRQTDGAPCWVHGRGQLQRDAQGRIIGMFGTIQDISQERRAQQRKASRSEILELIIAGTPLAQILRAMVLAVEQLNPDMKCSILLVDEAGERLLDAASPSLPTFYRQAVSGSPIGPGVGSCGTAAYRKERVIVEDIERHPYWSAFRHLTRQAGLAACWSQPILGAGERLLGTFAIYHATPQSPSPEDIQLIEQNAALASIAIEKHRSERALRISEQRLRFALEGAGDGIWEYDLETGINRVSPGSFRILGMAPAADSPAQANSQNPEHWPQLGLDVVLHPESLHHSLEALQRIRDGLGQHYEVEQQVRCADGRYKCRGKVVDWDEQGRPLRLIGTSVDIDERKQREDELADQARQDDLTGLLNRRHFMQLAQREISRGKRHPRDLSLLMMDLDLFKQVNDTYGHLVGDAVLKHLAELCHAVLREEDLIARLGGEEFAVLLPDTSPRKAREVAERLRQQVERSPLVLDDETPIPFTLSIGIASLDDGPISELESLLAAADQALYAAKRAGRNRVLAQGDI